MVHILDFDWAPRRATDYGDLLHLMAQALPRMTKLHTFVTPAPLETDGWFVDRLPRAQITRLQIGSGLMAASIVALLGSQGSTLTHISFGARQFRFSERGATPQDMSNVEFLAADTQVLGSMLRLPGCAPRTLGILYRPDRALSLMGFFEFLASTTIAPSKMSAEIRRQCWVQCEAC